MTSVEKKKDVDKCLFVSSLKYCHQADISEFYFGFCFLHCLILINSFFSPFVVSSVQWTRSSSPKNFILSRENIKETLLAFRTNKSIVDITREVASLQLLYHPLGLKLVTLHSHWLWRQSQRDLTQLPPKCSPPKASNLSTGLVLISFPSSRTSSLLDDVNSIVG